MAEAQRLSLEDMNARLRAPATKRLSLEDMNAMLRGGTVEVDDEEPDAPSPTSRTARLSVYRSGLDELDELRRSEAMTGALLAREPSEVTSSVRARSTMADFPSPMNLPPAEAELEARRQASDAARRLPSSHGRPVAQPPLGERFRFNVADAVANTLRGSSMLVPPQKPDLGVYAEGFQTAPELAGTPLEGISDSPLGQAIREQSAKDYAAEKATHAETVQEFRRRLQFPLPSPRGALQTGTAIAGQLAGSATSPESLIPVARGANLLQTFLRGATAAGIANLATDPFVQGAQIEAGLRDKMDPVQTFLSGAGGALLGGTLNVTPEIAGRIARAVGSQFGKAASKVTNSDAFQAFRGWLQRPDAMPDELRIEPTFNQSANLNVDPGNIAGAPAKGDAATAQQEIATLIQQRKDVMADESLDPQERLIRSHHITARIRTLNQRLEYGEPSDAARGPLVFGSEIGTGAPFDAAMLKKYHALLVH